MSTFDDLPPGEHEGRLSTLHGWGSFDTFDGLNTLAGDVSRWHERELPGAPAWARVVKVAEEAGELVGAFLKVRQQQENAYRPERDYLAEARLELADVIVSAMGAAEALGVADVDALVASRWREVRERRFASTRKAAS